MWVATGASSVRAPLTAHPGELVDTPRRGVPEPRLPVGTSVATGKQPFAVSWLTSKY